MHHKFQRYARLVAGLSLFLLTSCAGQAQETLLAKDITLAPYEKWSAEVPQNVRIPDGHKAYLALRARINAKSVSTGSQPAFRATFDGVPIDISRLANKKTSYNVNSVAHRVWYSPDGRFDALYDDFSRTSPQAWGRNHDYFFDVTDIVEAGKKQTVVIENLFDGVPNSVLELRDCKFVVSTPVARNTFPASPIPYYLSEGFEHWRKLATAPHKGMKLRLETTTDYSTPLTVTSPPRFADVQASVTGDSSMGIQVKLGDWQPIPLQTAIGTPGTQWLQGRELRKLAVSSAPKSSPTWQASAFRVQRTFATDAHGVVVHDHVTNLTAQALPFAILYQLDAGDLSRLKEFRLYGKQEASLYANSIPSRESASYPVGYLRDNQRAYAFVMEDDSLRPHGSVMAWDSTVGFGSDMVCLEPHTSHTFQFRIVGAPGGNYFEILNRVRNAWNSYQTIPGLFGFVYPQGQDARLETPAQVKEFFASTGITVPAIPNSTPAPESGRRMIYGNEPAEMVREGLTSTSDPFAALMKQAGIDLPVLIYMDPHLIRSDGKKEILDTVADSVLNDIQGKRLDYRPGWLNVVLPRADNAAGKKIRENLNIYFDRPYIRGMFLDEWDHSRARHSFQHSDGLTARLNADLSLKAKIGLVPLLAKEFQQETVDFLTKNNAMTYVNQMAQTSFMQSLPLVHFAEPTQYDHYLLRSAQMARTPLSLNIKRTTGVWNDTYEFLKGGVLLAYYAKRLYGDHLLKYIYPIKVQGVQPGVVLAEDKIVTLRSGSYAFEDNAAIEALIFGGPDGNLKRKATSEAAAGGKHSLTLTLDSAQQEIALLRKVKP